MADFIQLAPGETDPGRIVQAVRAIIDRLPAAETAALGALLAANNLSDVANAATAFGNIKQAATTSATGVSELSTTTEVLTGTDAARSVTPDALAALWEKGSDVASAGTLSLGEGGYFHVTGTTTITDIDFATAKDGRWAILVFDAALTLTHNATTLILPGAANITTAAGDACLVVQDNSDNVKVGWYQRANGKAVGGSAPTRQFLLSGSSATYTTPAGCIKIIVKMIGGGGGGGAQATNNGNTGATTSFNSITAIGGSAGNNGADGSGGAGGTGGSGSADLRLPGSGGHGNVAGGLGAPGIFGMGAPAYTAGAANGAAGGTNTGAGGGGGHSATVFGGGGGSGEYVEFTISSPAATYTYTVGVGGSGGAAGTQSGGNGGSGLIIVEEYY